MVSTDCAEPRPALRSRPGLCSISLSPDCRPPRSREYSLAPGHPQSGDDLTVDEGSLSVHQMQGFLRIRTTKGVQFSHVFRGDQLAGDWMRAGMD
jgi:hypothetical protein